MKIFPNNFYNNNFGTVTVLSKLKEKGIEITPFRTEEKYTDKNNKINFVTHSLGGIVVRQYLENNKNRKKKNQANEASHQQIHALYQYKATELSTPP